MSKLETVKALGVTERMDARLQEAIKVMGTLQDELQKLPGALVSIQVDIRRLLDELPSGVGQSVGMEVRKDLRGMVALNQMVEKTAAQLERADGLWARMTLVTGAFEKFMPDLDRLGLELAERAADVRKATLWEMAKVGFTSGLCAGITAASLVALAIYRLAMNGTLKFILAQ